MRIVWIKSSDYFLLFFSQFELSNFSGILTMEVNGQWVPCVRNFYSLIPILLKPIDVVTIL